MHDIKYIRNNFSEFKKQVNNRNTEVNLDKDRITGSWKLIPKANINFITNDKYSLTLASSCIGRAVVKPVLSKERKNLIARGIIK